jgi:hypothetical protein
MALRKHGHAKFVLQKHKEDSLFWEKRLLTLGRNVSNSKYHYRRTTLALGRATKLQGCPELQGVGPKWRLCRSIQPTTMW